MPNTDDEDDIKDYDDIKEALLSTKPSDILNLKVADIKKELTKREIDFQTTHKKSDLVLLLLQHNSEMTTFASPTKSNGSGTQTDEMVAVLNSIAQLTKATLARPITVVNTVTDYMLQTLPFFYGLPTENANDWIKELKSLITRRKIQPDDSLINLPSRLKGQALQWHKAIGKDIESFDDYIDAFQG